LKTDDKFRIGGRLVRPLRDALESLDELEDVLSVRWNAIARELGLDEDESQLFEQKSRGDLLCGLGWSSTRTANVARRLGRKLRSKPLTGRRGEFVSYRFRSRTSLNPVRRRRIAGRHVWELERLDDTFLSIMRKEQSHFQMFQTKRNVTCDAPLVEAREPMNREFTFQIKSVDERGEFVGLAAVTETLDLGGDRIKRGAMAKSIQENPRIPLLLDHRIPIGVAFCKDTNEGLEVRGVLNLEKPVSKDAYSDLKFYLEHKTPYGMSIGYDAVKWAREGETRVLTELKIWECSITLFPMNPAAGVRAVKERQFAAQIARIKRLFDDHVRDMAAITDNFKRDLKRR